jgi:hypothetical protein
MPLSRLLREASMKFDGTDKAAVAFCVLIGKAPPLLAVGAEEIQQVVKQVNDVGRVVGHRRGSCGENWKPPLYQPRPVRRAARFNCPRRRVIARLGLVVIFVPKVPICKTIDFN